MSQLTDFLEALWPPDNTPSGYISAFAAPSNQSIHATSAAELEAAVAPLLTTSNLYIRATLIGNLPADGKRGGADLATYMPGIWADIDIKGPAHAASNLPPTIEKAIQAAYSLGPDPTIIVHTGNGIQAWWLFKEPEMPDADLVSRWQRGLAQASGWAIDNTADLARLMRLPGTYNLKDPSAPKPVKFKTSQIRHNPSDLLRLVDHIPSVPVSVPSTHRPSSPAALLPILQGCSWLKHCYDDAERLPYPEWYRMLGLLAACEDGHAAAHQYSLAHPGYKPTETDTRFEQAAKFGPPTCAYIQSMGHDCSACKHEGKIISPIVISRKKSPGIPAESWGEAVLDAPPEQPEVEPDDPTATSPEPPIEDEPDPFDEDILLQSEDPLLVLAMAKELSELDETDFQVFKAKAKAKFGSKLSGTALDKAVKAERKKSAPPPSSDDDGIPPNEVALQILEKHGVLNVDDTFYVYDGTKWTMTRATYLNHLALKADGEAASSKNRRTEIASFIAAKIYKKEHKWRNIEMFEVPLANGVIDVRTMKMRPHRINDYIQTCVPWKYDPKAKCPVLMRCLDTYFGGDEQGEAKIAALQEFFGYCLMPHARYKRALFCLGESDCGKSTIPFLLRILLGAENCTAVSVTAMDDERKRAPLLGKLVNLLTELTSEAMIADGGFKTLVSTEEPILFDVKWGGVFMDIPICKHVIVSNSKPGINDRSNGTYRRLLLVKFRHIIPAAEQDTTIWDQLRGEVAGILSWALEGAQRLYNSAGRFSDPGADEVAEYRKSENVMLSFIEHYCEADLSEKTPTSRFIERFNSVQPRRWRPNAVLQAVREAGFTVEVNQTASFDGKKYRHVLGLKVS